MFDFHNLEFFIGYLTPVSIKIHLFNYQSPCQDERYSCQAVNAIRLIGVGYSVRVFQKQVQRWAVHHPVERTFLMEYFKRNGVHLCLKCACNTNNTK